MVDDQLVRPLGEMALHLSETSREILGRHLKSNAEMPGKLNGTIISLEKRQDPGGCLRHSILVMPHEVSELTHVQICLDTHGGIRKHHIAEAAIDDTVVPDARGSCRDAGSGDDARPFFPGTARELARHPLQSHRLQVLEEPLGGDELVHKDGNVLVDRLVGVRLVRGKRKRTPDPVASKPGGMSV